MNHLLAPEPFKCHSNEDSQAFLDRLSAFATYKMLDDTQKASTFPLLLRNNGSVEDTKACYKKLGEAFNERYGTQKNRAWSHVVILFQWKQTSQESLYGNVTSMRCMGTPY